MTNSKDGPNWKKIKAEYIRGDISQRRLAAKYGVSVGTLRRRALHEKWSELRREADAKAMPKIIQKAADYRVEMADLFEQSGLEAIRAIYDGFVRFPNGAGTKITRFLSGKNEGEGSADSEKPMVVEHDLRTQMDLLATWAKVYGMDEASRLNREKLAFEKQADDHSMDTSNANMISIAELINHPMPDRSLMDVETGGDDCA